ncbi:MAG: PIN domain-containing protein [Rickettsia endosymbiont of Glossina mortisans submortisans]|nr:PIN domain-containing protein [Rickettsia endosymbiont of Glossina mortisans submortisans]
MILIILIDYFLGNLSARREISLYNNPQISIITKMEILVGTSKENQEIIESFFKSFLIINLNEEIAEIAVVLRKENKIKLPDAIIWATAKFTNSILSVEIKI